MITNTHGKFNTDSDNKTQISIIKKQIISFKQSIDHQKIKDKSVEKKANDLYLKIWDQQQNDIIHGINDVKRVLIFEKLISSIIFFFSNILGVYN